MILLLMFFRNMCYQIPLFIQIVGMDILELMKNSMWNILRSVISEDLLMKEQESTQIPLKESGQHSNAESRFEEESENVYPSTCLSKYGVQEMRAPYGRLFFQH